eukprot:CAMPEP_0195126150 /NCGR_PEP_ID=MMETSP0448-20130528/134348_1 /TAXON_ID=66468 /ORGANISM="Heterocapsa triquestra, Strain CCMP 448" /LENGTH=152 /DNA_ID=CAMNT_0040163827 /DNA_START=20 /DNA_END=475 /DNA_ORIENTATION=+
MAETLISFASQTLNAQMAQMELGAGLQVPLWSPFVLLGPGVTVHVLRNIVALSGIRIFSWPCQTAIMKLVGGHRLMPAGLIILLGDFVASLGAAVLSAPLNQCHNFAVCSGDYYHGSPMERVSILLNFMGNNYLAHDADGRVVGLTATLPRD